MALDIYNPPAPQPDAGGALPQGLGGMQQGQMPAPYVQGGANGQFGSQAHEGHQKLIRWADPRQTINIADELDETLLNAIGQRVTRERTLDLGTRADWEERSRVAMDLAMQVAAPKMHPWPGASNIIYPAMTIAGVQFAARAYPAIVQGRNVVKGVVTGPDKGIPQTGPDGQPMMQPGPDGQPQPVWLLPPGAKRERADRIGQHMSWQLLEEMKEWEEETDKLLHILPIIGCCFRKSYFNPAFGTNVSVLVMPLNIIINYWAKSLERAPRISEDIKLYPVEIEEMIRSELFLEHDYGIAANSNGDEDAPHDFIEQHRALDLDEDGYPEPYVVTVHKQTGRVARIVARYDTDGVHVSRKNNEVVKIDPVYYYTKFDFWPNSEGGIYGVGFGQLLSPINKAINTTLNMLVDAGHLQNTGGGWVGRGLSMHSGAVRFKLGEWKVVNAPGQTVRDAVVPMQWPGPSAVLFSLLGTMIEAAKEVSNVKDVLTGETNPNVQPTTLLALIEQGVKVFTAIYKRVHRGAKEEYKKLYRLNRIYMESQARYQVGDEWKAVTREDYAKGAGVVPVSDPAMVSDMQRMARAQFLQSYQNDPLCDGAEIRRQVFDAAQIEGADKIIHGNMPPNPQIIAKAAEMELKGHEAEARMATEKAKQIESYTRSVLNLANADKVVGDQHLGWIEQHIDLYRAQMESLMQPKEGGPSPGQQLGPPQIPPHPGGMGGMPPGGRPMPPAPMPVPQETPEMSFHNGPFARPGGGPPSEQ